MPRLLDSSWSADLISDALICGIRSRLLNIVDDFDSEAVYIVVDKSINSVQHFRVFERLRKRRDQPRLLRADPGPEFLEAIFVQGPKNSGTAIRCMQPCKPNQNADIERVNRTPCKELRDQHLFARLKHVREAAD